MARNLPRDMDPQDILAAVRKSSHKSLAGLGRAHNLEPGTLRAALVKSAPRYEAIIAAAIGKTALEIWPSRFTPAFLEANPWRRFALAQAEAMAANKEVSGSISKHGTEFRADCNGCGKVRNVEPADSAAIA